MPLQATSGAASYDAFGGGVPVEPNYIESVFQTYLYTGNGSTQTITNGIDLAGKGGLVWVKSRSNAYASGLNDSVRGVNKQLISSQTVAEYNNTISGTTYGISAFNSNGFSLNGDYPYDGSCNNSGSTYVSWTFRKQPKFFDVVTYTGTGSVQNISHNLGSVPGFIIVKRTDTTSNWICYHRSLNTTAGGIVVLNLSAYGELTDATCFNSTVPTSSVFTVGTSAETNGSGGTFVAYIYAHNAGGFGLTGTDNVISCGGFSNPTSTTTINLGYEPQWVLIKNTDAGGSWYLSDNMRGFVTSDSTKTKKLSPNSSSAEGSSGYTANDGVLINSTGFSVGSNYTGDSIYIAIRRGPMKVPTVGTTVFSPSTASGSSSAITVTAGFPTDMLMVGNRGVEEKFAVASRLIGQNAMKTWSTAAESSALFGSTTFSTAQNSVYIQNGDNITNASGQTYVDYMFRRAPSFFDEVCYTGDGTADSRTFTHNLGATPQLVIVKRRSSTSDWVVMFNTDHAVLLNSTNADTGYSTATGNYANGILIGTNSTTLTQYSGASGNSACNASGSTYVAYLFATCAGVSKVFSFTGSGSLQTINCGFTSGARFVLVKRTDSTGDWYVWDSARGISSSTDPYLLLNSTAAEVTSTNWVDTTSTGFQVTAASGNNVNINGATYIGLAIA